jgi:hypothetical protein
VRVADVGREKFQEAHVGALAGGGDQSRACSRERAVGPEDACGKSRLLPVTM